MEKMLNEEIIERDLISLIEDEDDANGAGSPAIISAVTAVTALLTITSACTRSCWRP